MKNLFLSLFFVASLIPLQADAIATMAGDTVILSDSSEDDTYSVGRKIINNEVIGGDLIAAGQSLDIVAPVSGDLVLAGQFLDIAGEVGDDARLAGQRIVIGAMVGDSVMAFGQDVTVKNGAKIKGDLWVWGETVILNGEVQGDVRIEASQVVLNAPIGGEAKITAVDSLQIGANGRITGNLDLVAPETIDQTKVNGEISFTAFDEFAKFENTEKDLFKKITGFIFGFAFLKYLGLIAIAAFLIWAIKNYLLNFVKTGKKNWLSNLGIGFVIFFLVPIAVFFLLVTLVGIPLAGILFLFYALALLTTSLIVGFLVGNLIIPINAKSSFSRILGSFALGLLIYMLLTLIPIFGWIAKFVFFLIAFGTLGQLKWDFVKTLKKAKKV